MDGSDTDGSASDAAVEMTTPEWTPVDAELVGPTDDAYTFALATQPSHGWASVAGATVTYYPEPYYDGPDSFTYDATASDGTTTTMTASVAVEETSSLEDGVPVALDDVGEGAIAPFLVEFTDTTYTDTPTPYTMDRAGFCRLFYDPDIDGAEGLWLAATLKNSAYGNGAFAIQALDLELNPIPGTEKILTDSDGKPVRATGDTHHATSGRHYYAAVGGCGNTFCSGDDGHGTVYEFDRDWELVAEPTFDFDRENYRSNDMLLSYANRQVFFGIAYAENCGEAPNDQCENLMAPGSGAMLFGYSPADGTFSEGYRLGEDTISSMGGSLVFDGTAYWLIGNDGSANVLSANRYESLDDASSEAVTLTSDGQWAQAAFFDDGRLVVVHHTGPHGFGDVEIRVWSGDLTESSNAVAFDVDQPLGDPAMCGQGLDPFDDSDDCSASNPACADVECDASGSACTSCELLKDNAQRPFVARVRDTLYVTYDFAPQAFTSSESADQPDGRASWTHDSYETKEWECYVGAVSMVASDAWQ